MILAQRINNAYENGVELSNGKERIRNCFLIPIDEVERVAKEILAMVNNKETEK